jgi:hypothetical protein
VISVVLYGRNDAHGYNLHRRAALSLNCIAEVLTDAADEILFVDYNTPDELPTFIEALSDTLTDRCLDLLRVIRVPAAVHEERFGGRTHLPALEPVARNAAVRRANPANRWLLSTNTDMVFLPSAGGSFSDVCRKLPDGFYGLPRYELPEWLWERLPRSDPGRALAEIARLGPTLRLDEPTLSNEWIRFDAPGDFQLVLREDFFAVDGFDEEMILGYHVDSNFSKRMLLHRGSIESLGERLAGYHCNHNRTPTVYHGAQKVTNDLERFFISIERPELPAQRDSWGLVDDALEEIPVRERSGEHFAAAVAAATPAGVATREPSDAARIPYELTYDSGHVLPFVADSLAVTPPDATVGYVGVNTVLQESLAALIAELGSGRSLTVAELDDLSSLDGLVGAADVFVVDLGIDLSLLDGMPSRGGDHQLAQLPAKIVRVFLAFERLVELERARVQAGAHPRRFVLVHSWTVFWDAYVLAHLDCSHATAHSRVRRATVRAVPADDGRTRELVRQERRVIRWAGRGELGRSRLHLHPREPLVLAELSDYGGFGDGWAFPDESGLWTQGPRSELALALDGIDDGDPVLRLSLGSICVPPDSAMRVSALVGGKTVATRDFNHGDPDWHLELPVAGVTDGSLDLAFEIEEPGSPRELGWSTDDDRPLGILLRTVTLLRAEDAASRAGLARERRLAAWNARAEGSQRRLHIRPGETVDLAELSNYGGFRAGWAYHDEAGIWTHGPRARLALALDGIGESDYVVGLSLGSICVEPEATLTVNALVNGERVAVRDFYYGDPEWQIELPSPVPADGEVELTFEVEEPRSPQALGWSDDDRKLGILLRALTLEEVDRSVRLGEKIVFGEGSGAERFLGEGWAAPEPAGVWTDGEQASLVLRLTDGVPEEAELALRVAPFVTPDHPVLEVEASALAEQLAARVFRHGEAPRLFRISLPPPVRGQGGRTIVELRLRDPARPADLGLGDDLRRLGVQLRWLVVRKSTWRATLSDALRATYAKFRRRTSRSLD